MNQKQNIEWGRMVARANRVVDFKDPNTDSLSVNASLILAVDKEIQLRNDLVNEFDKLKAQIDSRRESLGEIVTIADEIASRIDAVNKYREVEGLV